MCFTGKATDRVPPLKVQPPKKRLLRGYGKRTRIHRSSVPVGAGAAARRNGRTRKRPCAAVEVGWDRSCIGPSYPRHTAVEVGWDRSCIGPSYPRHIGVGPRPLLGARCRARSRIGRARGAPEMPSEVPPYCSPPPALRSSTCATAIQPTISQREIKK